MNFSTVFNQVLILFSIMAVGFFTRRKKIISSETSKQLSSLLLDVAVPCTIISSFITDTSKSSLQGVGQMLIISFFFYLGSTLLGAIVFRKCEASVKKILWFSCVFSNSMFMGFPVIESIFGKPGILYASVMNINFNLFAWTFGYILFTGRKDIRTLKNALTNTNMIAIFIGLIFYLLHVSLPYPVSKSLDLLGSLTTPLSMIVVGSTMAEISFGQILSGVHIYLGSAVRLLLVPALTLAILHVMGITGIVAGVVVITAAMPAGAATVMFSEKFGGDSQFASRCVFLSTAASIITIPIILLFL